MLLLPNPKKLMLGYLLGAYMTSITLGLLIVFSLNDTEQRQHREAHAQPDRGHRRRLIALLVAYVLGSGRAEPLRERRRRRKEAKAEKAGEAKESWPERMLGRGSARITFALGVVLTFPGVSYLTALDRIAKLDEHRPDRADRPRLLPDPAAAARAAAARLRDRAGAHRSRGHRLPRLAGPQRPPRGDDRRRGDRGAVGRARPDRAARPALVQRAPRSPRRAVSTRPTRRIARRQRAGRRTRPPRACRQLLEAAVEDAEGIP